MEVDNSYLQKNTLSLYTLATIGCQSTFFAVFLILYMRSVCKCNKSRKIFRRLLLLNELLMFTI